MRRVTPVLPAETARLTMEESEMTGDGRSVGPGPGLVIAGAIVGGAVSLVFGLLVAAILDSWLAIDWARGISTIVVGALVAAVMLRVIIQTARGRLQTLRQRPGERP